MAELSIGDLIDNALRTGYDTVVQSAFVAVEPMQPFRNFHLCILILRDVGARICKDSRPQLPAPVQRLKMMLKVSVALQNDPGVFHNVCSFCLREHVPAQRCSCAWRAFMTHLAAKFWRNTAN